MNWGEKDERIKKDLGWHCCRLMEYYLANEDKIVDYWNKYDEYGIPVHDGGESMIVIEYCPWCGKKLPESKRG